MLLLSPIGVLWSEGNQGGNKYLPLVIQQRLPSLPNREGGDSIVTLSHKETQRDLTGGGKGDGETLDMQGQERGTET